MTVEPRKEIIRSSAEVKAEREAQAEYYREARTCPECGRREASGCYDSRFASRTYLTYVCTNCECTWRVASYSYASRKAKLLRLENKRNKRGKR